MMKSAISLFVLILVVQSALYARIYDPKQGGFISRDPMEDDSLGNLYAPFERNPGTFTDPLGLLTRKQVQWIGKEFLGDKTWDVTRKEVGIPEVAAKLKEFKAELKRLHPEAGLSAQDTWSETDDYAFQVILDSVRQNKKKCTLEGFPGNTWDPITDAKAIADLIKRARAIYDLPAVDDATLIAWFMKESNWSPSKSPYGYMSGESSAQGISQITRSTWEDLLARGRVPTELNKDWETITSDSALSIAAGLFILKEKMGDKSLAKGLENYKGGDNKDDNRRYAELILSGASHLRGVDLSTLKPNEATQILKELDKIVRGK